MMFCYRSTFLTIGAVIGTVAAAVVGHNDLDSSSCRCIPGDACWPTPLEWSQLNATVAGRLIATHQVANVCHGATYNDTACAVLRDNWDLPETQYVVSYLPGNFLANSLQYVHCW